jgi:hypothetical protein
MLIFTGPTGESGRGRSGGSVIAVAVSITMSPPKVAEFVRFSEVFNLQNGINYSE